MATPQLKSTTKAITHIKWHEMCDFLQALFGVEEFVWNDCSNGRYDRVQIDAKDITSEMWTKFDHKTYAKYKEQGYIPEYGLRVLFCGLVAEGHLPPGDYLVHNSW